MKSLLAFFIFIINCWPTNAQSWVNPANRWHIQNLCTGSEPFGGGEVLAYFLKDTLRQNGEVYLQMHKTLDTTFQTSIPTGNYYREKDNKVYLLQPGSPERLIYDFNLTAGDTLTIDAGFFKLPIKVIAIDSVILEDGSKRKRLTIQDNRPFEDRTAFWVEGIGSDLAPLDTWSMFISDCGSNLHCFYQQNELLYMAYPNDPYSCVLRGETVSIKEITELKNIKIFPNPFSNDLYMDAELIKGFPLNHDYTIIISDAQGRRLYQNKGNQINNFHINTTHWRSGFYFLIIQSEGRILSRKLLKK